MNLKIFFRRLKQKILNREFLAIFGVFILSLVLRTLFLSHAPFRFHNDEVISGYMGRFILLNGKDLYGNSWPLFYFDYFGDYRVILPMYLNGLSTFIFGVNEFAVRFPTAFIGSLIVFPIYSISKILLGKRKLALILPLLIAIFPWHINLSRATSEGIVGLTVFTFGLSLLIKSLNEDKGKLLAPAVVLFALTYFLYPSFRLLSPLVFLPIPFLLAKGRSKRGYIIAMLTLFFLTLLISTTAWGKGRYIQTSLFNSSEVATQIKSQSQAQASSEKSVLMAKIFDNKIVGYTRKFVSNYSEYFSPSYLFINGGLPDRYAIPNFGLLYLSFAIFLLGLLLPTNTKLDKRIFLYTVLLLFIAPLPGALTVDDIPNIHRALFMIVPLVLLSGIGFCKIIDLLIEHKQRIILNLFIFILSVSFLTEFTYFTHQYLMQEPSFHSFNKEDGFREVALYIKQIDKNKNILMPYYGALPVYYLFFTNDFNRGLAGTFQKGLTVNKINNVTFSDNSCPANAIPNSINNSKLIIVEDGQCAVDSHFKEVNSIYRRDSTKAFKILEII